MDGSLTSGFQRIEELGLPPSLISNLQKFKEPTPNCWLVLFQFSHEKPSSAGSLKFFKNPIIPEEVL